MTQNFIIFESDFDHNAACPEWYQPDPDLMMARREQSLLTDTARGALRGGRDPLGTEKKRGCAPWNSVRSINESDSGRDTST